MTEQATEKQIEFAKKLGINTPEVFSKQVLRELIQNKLAESEEGNGRDEQPKPLKPGYVQPTTGITAQRAPTREFHLSPEQVNTNALNAAIEWKTQNNEADALMTIAHKFKEFIQNGN